MNVCQIDKLELFEYNMNIIIKAADVSASTAIVQFNPFGVGSNYNLSKDRPFPCLVAQGKVYYSFTYESKAKMNIPNKHDHQY